MTRTVLERDIFGTPLRWGEVQGPDLIGSDLPDAHVTNLVNGPDLDELTKEVLGQEIAACLCEIDRCFADWGMR